MITLLHEQRETALPRARADGDALWLERDDVEGATGWAVPLPRGREAALVRGDELDIAALWRHMGHPVVHDKARETWVLGTGAGERARALASLEAPDFALPDLAGKTHRLSDHRGRKVFLATWASW
jgi:hypothetical protein